jgi:hypothetical protein
LSKRFLTQMIECHGATPGVVVGTEGLIPAPDAPEPRYIASDRLGG